MSNTLEISENTYRRLSSHAVGFDTPESVIIRLLDSVENKDSDKPELLFSPVDEVEFKKELLDTKEAEVILYKNNGSRRITYWKAHKLNEKSNLRANLWSGPLRGWKKKGIVKAEISTLPDSQIEKDNFDETKAKFKDLAYEFGISYKEMSSLSYRIETRGDKIKCPFNIRIIFDESCDQGILNKIEGLQENSWVTLDKSVFRTF
jgi:hypothetical protein